MIARLSILSGFLIALAPLAFADSVVIYDNIPSALPPNLPSLGYEATSTAEFGGMIQFSGDNPSYALSSATVAMSDWALASTYSSTSTGFSIPLTLNLYNVGASNTVGSLISSQTVDAYIPWRPEASGTTGCMTGYIGSDGSCYNGSLSLVTFDLAGITAPASIIYGLAFNTTDHGASPTGIPGPNESLNFGLSGTDPSSGSLPLPGTAYWNTSYGGFYADGGTGGTGTLRQDDGTDWSQYAGAIEFTSSEDLTATPEPSSLLLLGTGLLGLSLVFYRRSKPAICRESTEGKH